MVTIFSFTILPAFFVVLSTGNRVLLNMGLSFLLGFIFLVIISFIWSRLMYKYYLYEVRDDGFRKEQGVISKKYTTIPYERIQNDDIYRGLMARILGLSDLHIQTAGASVSFSKYGAGSEGRLQGLSPEVAEQLRDELIRRAKGNNQQGV